MEEIKLIKKAKKGNSGAFEKLLILHQDQLYRTAYIYVQNQADALDVVQETAYKAYISLEQLEELTFFKTWLIRILMNNAFELLRKRKKIIHIQDEFRNDLKDKAESPGNTTEINMDLQIAIQQLEHKYQMVIMLFYYHDFSVQQIALQMGIPEGTVKTYLHRARKALKKILEGSDPTWKESSSMTR